MLKKVEVWRALSPVQAVRYNCVQNLESGLFRVCTADFLTPDASHDSEQARYFIENILEHSPDSVEQPEWFDTVEAAIEAHDRDFGN